MLLKGAYCVGEHFVDPQSMIKNTNLSKLKFGSAYRIENGIIYTYLL